MRTRASVRRVGRSSVVDIDGIRTLAVSAQVDRLGFGTYQWIVLVSLGIAMLSDALESGSMEPLNRAMDIAFQLPLWVRACLPAVHCVGSLVGIALAGPVCDRCGRKKTLVFALALMAASSLVFAALPLSASSFTLLALRLCQGFANGFGYPCLYVLLVESCPTPQRTSIMYAAHAFAALGYLVGALGLQTFMPGLGQDPSDRWRQFSLFIALPPLLSLPLVVAFLSESPYFYAVHADTSSCVKVLNAMACKNGMSSLTDESIILPDAVDARTSSSTSDWALSFRKLSAQGPLMLLLCALECGRTTMTCGSAYIWPQLFIAANTEAFISPSSMNVIASISPFIGLICFASLAWLGTRRIVLMVSAVAATSLFFLTRESLRSSAGTLLLLVIITKCCYGPLHASLSLMKTESFPTEVRATAFAIITVVAGLGRIATPIIAEVMKGNEEEWDATRMTAYLAVLAIIALGSGFLVLSVPASCSMGAPLEDFVVEREKGKRGKGRASLLDPQYGATKTDIHDIWAESRERISDAESTSDSKDEDGGVVQTARDVP